MVLADSVQQGECVGMRLDQPHNGTGGGVPDGADGTGLAATHVQIIQKQRH